MLKEPIYYLNGKYISKSKAKISVNDLGFLRNYSVFEFLRTYNGIPFYLDAHLTRLENSAKTVGIKLPNSQKMLKKIITKLLDLNKQFNEKKIHIIVTGGRAEDSITYQGKPTIVIMIGELIKNPPTIYRQGIKVITEDYNRNNSSAKTTDYFHAIKSLQKAKSKGAEEVIYLNNKEGLVYEGSRSTVFIVKNGKVQSPNHGVLPGITASVVLKLLQKEFTIIKEMVTPKELFDADEIFITATTKEIVPVVQVNNMKVGNGKVGSITKLIMSRFETYTENWSGKEVN